MFIDPNAHTPVSRAMRAMYKDRNGNEVVPAHVVVVNDVWYTVSSLIAAAAMRPNEK